MPLSQKWRTLSLQVQIFLPVCTVLAVGLLLSYWHTTTRVQEAAAVTANRWSTALVHAAGAASANALVLNDLASLEEMLLATVKLPGVLQIEVLDVEHVSLLRLARESIDSNDIRVAYRPAQHSIPSEPRMGLRPVPWGTTHAWLSWEPIGQGVALGYIGLVFQHETHQAALHDIQREQWWLHLGVGFVTLLTAFYLLRNTLRPLRRLTHHARNLPQNTHKPLEHNSNSREVSDLTDAVNLLHKRLRSQIQQLAFSEANWIAVLEGMPDGVLVLAPTGRIQMMNAAARQILQVEAGAYQNEDIRLWLPQFSAQWTDPLTPTTQFEFAEDTPTQQTLALRGRLHPFPAEVSLSFVNEAGLSQYICLLRDVTERNRIQQKLVERTARFHAVVDLSPDGIAVFDHRDQLVVANPALGEMLGWAQAIDWEDLSLAAFERYFAGLSENGQNFPPLADGNASTRPEILVLEKPRHRVLARSWRRQSGEQAETVLYFRDITYETEVDRMKSEFLNSAAHELRTPLASVYGFSELLLRRQLPADKQRELIQTMHDQAGRLSRIINELLDLARIEARRGQDFDIQPCPVGELVRSTLASLVMPGDTRQVDCHFEDENHLIWADREKTRQVLLNVLTNAYKYSPNGGAIELHTWRESPPLGQARVCISVVDHGMGMTPEQASHLYERFWRADTSGHIPGTGLGMSLVKEVMQLQGGSVDVHTEWQVGTRVTLRLPHAQATDR